MKIPRLVFCLFILLGLAGLFLFSAAAPTRSGSAPAIPTADLHGPAADPRPEASRSREFLPTRERGLESRLAGPQDLAEPEGHHEVSPAARRPTAHRPSAGLLKVSAGAASRRGWSPAAFRIPPPYPGWPEVPPRLLKYLDGWPTPGATAAEAWPEAEVEADEDQY
ncbi:MAG: hypothetical protein WC443_04690 [Desulfobaccales bacterium]